MLWLSVNGGGDGCGAMRVKEMNEEKNERLLLLLLLLLVLRFLVSGFLLVVVRKVNFELCPNFVLRAEADRDSRVSTCQLRFPEALRFPEGAFLRCCRIT
jgi:hypothetical protein